MVEQQEDDSIVQHQDEYLAALGEIDIATDRAKQVDQPVTESERTQLRALLWDYSGWLHKPLFMA